MKSFAFVILLLSPVCFADPDQLLGKWVSTCVTIVEAEVNVVTNVIEITTEKVGDKYKETEVSITYLSDDCTGPYFSRVTTVSSFTELLAPQDDVAPLQYITESQSIEPSQDFINGLLGAQVRLNEIDVLPEEMVAGQSIPIRFSILTFADIASVEDQGDAIVRFRGLREKAKNPNLDDIQDSKIFPRELNRDDFLIRVEPTPAPTN